MTLTPKDFSAITGLQVNGKRLKYDLKIYDKPNKLKRLVGEPLASLGKKNLKGATHSWIHNVYQNFECCTDQEEDVLTRVFVLVLLGSTIFHPKDSRVCLHYLPSLEKISTIAEYNWGGSALAFLYCNTDSLCRGFSKASGGYSKVWKIWACQYIPSLARANTGANTFPRALCWSPHNVVSHSLAEYRVILRNLVCERTERENERENTWSESHRTPTPVTGRRNPFTGIFRTARIRSPEFSRPPDSGHRNLIAGFSLITVAGLSLVIVVGFLPPNNRVTDPQ
ncbi:hypothetical protein ACLB2K_021112 [Fragaria x ananassa]